MPITRRDLLISATSGAALFVVGRKLERKAPSVPAVQLSSGPASAAMFPSEAGELTRLEHAGLWALCRDLGQIWSMSGVAESELCAFVDMKTRTAPSYLEEYRNALDLYSNAAGDALTQLLRKDVASFDEIMRMRLTHMRQFVLDELVLLHIARGGLRQFGILRAPGFIGDRRNYRVFDSASTRR